MGVNSLTGVETLQEMASVFKAFSHEARLNLLIYLNEEDKTAKDLSELLKTTQTYVHRHLQIMIAEGLVEKEGRFFSLSTAGKIFVNSIGWLEVITKYNRFWENHSIYKIPENLIRDVAVLKHAKLISPAPRVIKKTLMMISKANKRILAISDRLPEIGAPAIEKSIENGLQEAYALAADIPPNFKSFHRAKNLPPIFKSRITNIENIYLGILIIDEKEACVLFPDHTGLLDWNYSMIGKDPSFISWVEKNFWEMYNKSNDLTKNPEQLII